MLRMREAHHQMARPGFAQALARDQRGVFVNTGFHTLYIMPYLLDEKPVSVTAVSQRASGLSCEDNGVSVLSFASGCLAVHETSYLSEQSPFSFGVYGDRGTLLMGGPQADLRVNTGGGVGTCTDAARAAARRGRLVGCYCAQVCALRRPGRRSGESRMAGLPLSFSG